MVLTDETDTPRATRQLFSIYWFLNAPDSKYTDKKENQIFLLYREIQSGADAKSNMTNGLLK